MLFSSNACRASRLAGTSLSNKATSNSALRRYNTSNTAGAAEWRWPITTTKVGNASENQDGAPSNVSIRRQGVTTRPDRLKAAGTVDADLNVRYYGSEERAYRAYHARGRRKPTVVHYLKRKNQDFPNNYTKHESKDLFRAVRIEQKEGINVVQSQSPRAKASEKTIKAVGGNSGPQPTPSPRRVEYDGPLVKKYVKDYVPVRRHPTGGKLKLKAFPAHNLPQLTDAYPKLDTFLFDDFEPVLGMLLEATPKLTTRAEGEQLDLDSEYRQGEELEFDESMDSIGDLIDDITYAPPSEPPRVRSFLTGTRGGLSGLALQQRPEKWTQHSFLGYLNRLIAVGARAKDQDAEQLSTATEEIIYLLGDDSFLPYVTNRALNIGIDYLSWQKEFVAALQIYDRLRDTSFSFDSLDFSRFLFAAACEETALYFRPILEDMLDSGLHPTGHTWYTFYQMICRKFPDKRRQVLVAMQNKGLIQEGRTVKEALVISLGWIEKSTMVPEPPLKPFHSTLDKRDVSEPVTGSKQTNQRAEVRSSTHPSRMDQKSELVLAPPVKANSTTKANTPFSMSELLSRP